MKKIIVLLAALAIFSAAAVAQDTITMFDPYYMYRPFVNEDTIDCIEKNPDDNGCGRYLAQFQLYVPTTPTTIYGVSVVFDMDPTDPTDSLETNYDSVYQDVRFTAIIYAKEGPAHYVIIDSVGCGISPYRGIFLYQDFGVNVNTQKCYTRDFREFYFDHPCTVSDTCFIGIRADYTGEIGYPPMVHVVGTMFTFMNDDPRGFLALSTHVDPGYLSPCDEFTLLPRSSVHNLGSCEYILSHTQCVWGGTFPIIGFHCKTPPQGLHYSSTGSGYYDLTWNSNDGGTYEVAVGLYGDNPDTVSRRYVTTDTTMRLDSLVPGTIYAVWVRGQCHYSTASYDTVIWSAWSGKIPVVATATGVQEAAGPSFELNPNPASRTVNVSCEATEGTIEVVDMDGRLWLQVPATQHTLDISRMGWGYYVVRLTTPEGTAIRLLQVN